MKYIDLHCDTLTSENVLQVTNENLQAGECFLQCFAAFVREQRGGFSRALALSDQFYLFCKEQGFSPVTKVADLKDGINALFTVEGGEAIEGDLANLETLYARGARIMTLVWNYPNELGFPNFPDYQKLIQNQIPPYLREKERGLTTLGREVVARMNELHMLVDVSHGSDKLVKDVADLCRDQGAPFLATHSGASAIQSWARNLEDEEIRMIANSGGVIGLDFCADFTSSDHTPEGQKFALLAHAEHIIKIGGEDVLAIGSDFDGMSENPYLKNPAFLPKFLNSLTKKFGERIAEKIAFQNALRVLSYLE